MERLKSSLGFLLVCFACVHSSEAECGGVFTAPSGTIQSPRFPSNYTNNVSCIYLITAPRDQRVTLNFTHFDLEPPFQSKCVDYVEIREGNSSLSPRMGQLCNNTLPTMRRSFGHQMWIKFVTDGSVVRSGFRATYTTGTYDNSSFFIASSGGSVIRMDADTKTNCVLYSTLGNLIAVDYDPVDQRVYWTEVGTFNNMINSLALNGTGSRAVINAGPGAVFDGLAIDPFSRLLFYTDAGNDVIGTMTLSTHAHRTIINSSLDKPRAIVLHTADGIMFWTDWGGPAKIERANYDGSHRRTIVNYHLLFINALALDMANNRLYWADAGTSKVEYSDLEGRNRPSVPILHLDSKRHFIFGMDLFRHYLYLTDWGPDQSLSKSSMIIEQSLGANRMNRSVVGSTGKRLNGFHAYDQNVLTSGPNGCGNNNGGCSVICIPLPGNRSKCLCPDGETLLEDKVTCVNAKLFITTTPSTTTTTARRITTTTTPTTTTTTPTTTTTTPTTTTTTVQRRQKVKPRLSKVPVVVKTSHSLPFIADGSSKLTLTCDLDQPARRYAWNVQCSSQSGNWCVFQPKVADDGMEVNCTAILANGWMAAGSLVLSLKYPPQTAPHISGYEDGSPLQAGDSLAMSCSVEGGKPLASAVIFSCPGHQDGEPDIRGKAGVQSLLTISQLRMEDNGIRCECRGEWDGTSALYPPRQTITLLVVGGGITGTSMRDKQEATTEATTEATVMDLTLIIGGGSGGFLGLVILIIIIVVIVKRKKPDKKRRCRTKRKGEDPYSDLVVINEAFNALRPDASDKDPPDPFQEAIYTEVMDLPIPGKSAPFLPPPLLGQIDAPLPPPPPPHFPCSSKKHEAAEGDYLQPVFNPAHLYHKSPSSPPLVPPKPNGPLVPPKPTVYIKSDGRYDRIISVGEKYTASLH